METLERLEACEQIRRLIAIYAQLLDSRRIDDWGELFSEDAVFRVWGRSYRGRSEIKRELGGMQRPDAPGKHALLQPVIDPRVAGTSPRAASSWPAKPRRTGTTCIPHRPVSS